MSRVSNMGHDIMQININHREKKNIEKIKALYVLNFEKGINLEIQKPQ